MADGSESDDLAGAHVFLGGDHDANARRTLWVVALIAKMTAVVLHVWRIGPQAHAAIVGVTGPVSAESIRARLAPIPELAHVTVERR